MQNIISRTKYPVVEETVKLVKNSFSVPKGYTLIQADYSQAELRLMAHYSQDKRMMDAYKKDLDLHMVTAAAAKSLSVEKWHELDEKVKKQSRFEAKAENFGLIYGMSAGGFRNYARVQYGLIIGPRKAEERRNSFFKTYPALTTYHNTYKAKGYKFGYVRTMFGRKVLIPDLKSYNRIKVGHAERNCINSPIQGTAGEMTIFAFALLMHILDERVYFVNTIHDSILFYVPDDILEETILLIKTVMENLPIEVYFDRTLSLPMKADFERSKESWGQLT
jgi:DNA polymerase-1